MNTAITRRHFFRAGSATIALAALTPPLFAAEETATPTRRTQKKAIMWGTVGTKGSVLDKMKAVKAAGFDGVEMASHMDQAEVLKARDATGLEITSVCGERHWKQTLSHQDPKVREEGLAALKQTLRDAKAYGAGSILLVPGVVNNEVTFDECWKRSIEQIRLAIPLAQELSVKISIENVWNNFITTEDQAVRYLDEINSPWVGWHFDCGNIIRYGDPIVWIKALGKRVNRVHIKEYSRDRAMRSGDVWKGFNAALLEGANNWPGIMKAFDEVGYQNYLITEQGGGDTPEGLHDLCARLEKIIAS
ncbi:MAG: sugar phosphate isomerase/epimerase family protein [Verrucomicrobiota bacterium]